MRKSENNRYFVVVCNMTFCTPDTIKSKAIELDKDPESVEVFEKEFEAHCTDIAEAVINHPDDEVSIAIFPEVVKTEDGVFTCTIESAEEEIEERRNYELVKENTYKKK